MPQENTRKIAIVTGGSRGLGRNTVLNLAKRGIDSIFTYRSNRAEADQAADPDPAVELARAPQPHDRRAGSAAAAVPAAGDLHPHGQLPGQPGPRDLGARGDADRARLAPAAGARTLVPLP